MNFRLEKMTAKGHGMNWVIAAVFIVGEMVGGGIVAMPNAMIDAGIWAGIVVTILGAILSGYTGVQLGDNWTILQARWNEYKEHCRKPYPEIGYRAIGPKAKTFVTICLCATQFGIAVVFLLLAAKNISSFLNSFFSIHINYCYLIVIVAVLVTPFIMLKSPKDFWPIAVGAMTSTSIAVILIIVGAAHDSKECKPAARYPTVKFTDFGLAFGTIMFAYGGHGAFPTIQHDMREPHRFSRAVWIAYAIIFCMYLPVSIIGYVVYGDTLDDSVVNSLQIKWMQQTANVLITLHVFLTIVIVFSPLNQALEEGFKISHDFGIQRVVLRGATMAIITFVAISFPSFGYALDLVGGTTITMMTMLLPGIFNLFLVAGQKKRQDKEAQGLVKPDEEDTEYATIREVIKTTPWPILILNIVVLVFGVVGGVASTASAIKEIVNGNIASPCYVKIFRGGLKFTGSSSSLKCCGKFKNITSIAANVSRCFDN